MRPFLLFALLVGCAPGEAPTSSDSSFTGVLTSVDRSAMAYDGDAVLMIDSGGETVVIRVPARINLCSAREQIQLDQLRVGERVEVRGVLGSDGAIIPCENPRHLLRRLE